MAETDRDWDFIAKGRVKTGEEKEFLGDLDNYVEGLGPYGKTRVDADDENPRTENIHERYTVGEDGRFNRLINLATLGISSPSELISEITNSEDSEIYNSIVDVRVPSGPPTGVGNTYEIRADFSTSDRLNRKARKFADNIVNELEQTTKKASKSSRLNYDDPVERLVTAEWK